MQVADADVGGLAATASGTLLITAASTTLEGNTSTLVYLDSTSSLAFADSPVGTGSIDIAAGHSVTLTGGLLLAGRPLDTFGSDYGAHYVDSVVVDGLLSLDNAYLSIAPQTSPNSEIASVLFTGTLSGTGTVSVQPGDLVSYLIDVASSQLTLTQGANSTVLIADITAPDVTINAGDGSTVDLSGNTDLDWSPRFYTPSINPTTTVSLSGSGNDVIFRNVLTSGSLSAADFSIAGFNASDTVTFIGADAATTYDSAISLTRATLTQTAPDSQVWAAQIYSGATIVGAFNLIGDYNNSDSLDVFAGGFITLSAPCFAEGTRIRTTAGDVAVEHLRAGDTVRLAAGGTAPVRWIGHRRIDCRRHPNPADAWPVRIRAGAFGGNRPQRDLVLSPDHAVFAQGMLVPARYLINGATIVQENVPYVHHFHVELPQHAVLLAENLPAESWLDTGNRSAFGNGSGAAMATPVS